MGSLLAIIILFIFIGIFIHFLTLDNAYRLFQKKSKLQLNLLEEIIYPARGCPIEITETKIPGDTLQVKLNRYMLFPPLPETDLIALNIINNTINLANENNINKRKQIQYQTYSKLTIDVGNYKKVTEILNKLKKRWNVH